MRRLLLAALCGLATILLPAHARAQTLRIAFPSDIDVNDPTLATTYVGRIVFAGLCDKLVDLNEKLEIVPQLATSWEWSDDKTLVLHLRPGVQFQDGEPLDAASVKFTFERYLTYPGSFRRAEISSIDHVDVVDPLTVRIVLKTPSGAFLSQLTDRAGMVLPPKAVTAAGKDFSQHPVCSGPFSFQERVPQDHITLTKFPDYWDAKDIHFDKVVYQILVDSRARWANILAGGADMALIDPSIAVGAADHPQVRVLAFNALGYFGVVANLNNGPRSDNAFGKNPLVRQALDAALDRETIVQVVYNGMYQPNAQAVPPTSPFYDATVTVPRRDLTKARTLLARAGVPLPVRLDLLAANNAEVMQAAEVIQSMANDAGFDVHIQAMEAASALQAEQNGQFQAYLNGWSGRLDIDGNTYAFLHSGQANNNTRYSNPTVDQLLDEGRSMVDVAKRRAVYGQMWPILRQDLPIIYLWSPSNIFAMNAKLSGFRPVADGMIRLQGLEMGK